MLKPKKLFSLYKRPIKLKDGTSKDIYYVQYRDIFGRNFKSGISIGATNKGLAEILTEGSSSGGLLNNPLRYMILYTHGNL